MLSCILLSMKVQVPVCDNLTRNATTVCSSIHASLQKRVAEDGSCSKLQVITGRVARPWEQTGDVSFLGCKVTQHGVIGELVAKITT